MPGRLPNPAGGRRPVDVSGESPFGETGMGLPLALIRDDGQLQRGDRGEVDVQIFNFAG